MGGYLSLPAGWQPTPGTAAAWVERAFSYVSGQPPKIKKPKKTVK